MNDRKLPKVSRLDVIGLLLAGLINTFLALAVAGILIAPGTRAGQHELLQRALWIAENTLQWQGAWLFWFAVTLSFSWSYYALGRHLNGNSPWRSLSIGLAVVAAAVDIVGVLVNLTVVPELARALTDTYANPEHTLKVMFHAMESLSYALTNVGAFGLYSVAGLIILPAAFATPDYPRRLAWLGVGEWGIAAIATVLLIFAPAFATVPLLISFLLFAPWVWGSAWWLMNGK